MEFEPAEPSSHHWSEPKYPTDEEIAELPDYVHPATRWSLAFISFIAGSVAAWTAVMQLAGTSLLGLFGWDIIEPLPDAPPLGLAAKASAWFGLICGLCWMMAAITIARGRVTATAIWFLGGIVTGIIGAIL